MWALLVKVATLATIIVAAGQILDWAGWSPALLRPLLSSKLLWIILAIFVAGGAGWLMLLERRLTSVENFISGGRAASGSVARWALVYSSVDDGLVSDFDWQPDKEYVRPGVQEGDRAEGRFAFTDRTLNIERTNTAGVSRTRLRKYTFNEHVKDYVERIPTLSGQRRFRIKCEAKILGGPHSLEFILRDRDSKASTAFLVTHKETINTPDWRELLFELACTPGRDCFLRIDERTLGQAPSSVQIQKLIVEELHISN